MNSIIFTSFAFLCAAFTNLAFRKNSEKDPTSTSSGYLFLFYLFSFVTALVLSMEVVEIRFNLLSFLFGAVVGVLNVLLMYLTSKALNSGPAGLTFAFQNASAIFPALVLYAILGTNYGFSCTSFQLIGMSLVVFGLILGTKGTSQQKSTTKVTWKWLKYAVLCFSVQIMALTIMQGRCVFFEGAPFHGAFAFLAHPDVEDIWFMPGMFGTALCIQSVVFFREKRVLSRAEIKYGIIGGIANCGSTCLLLLATNYAHMPSEKAILFPLFAIGTIVLCNLWANRLYQEKFNYTSCAICSLGILVGSISL